MATRRNKRARQVQREEVRLPSFVARRYVVLSIFALAAVALVWRAVDQQILEKDFLQSEGADRYLARVNMEAHRGLITDRRGEVLALSTPVDSVAADPRKLRADSPSLDVLAQALEMPLDDLRRKLARYSKRHFVYLKRRLPPSHAQHIMEVAHAHHIKGLHLEHSYRRYYPSGEVFSHVLGFANHRDVGQEGVELAYNQALAGAPGAKRVLRDGRRRVVEDVENIQSPRDGKNLALSLDARLQYLAYRELKTAVKRHRAVGGSAVMLDARTGEVLAMVNQPGYNPNARRSNQNGQLRNRALTDVYEPGSTMKPFAVAAGLELGVVDADEVIDTSPGYFHIGRRRVADHHNNKEIDLTTLLARSSNVGAAKIALAMESEDYWRMLDRFGFGRSTNTAFPAEGSGQLIDWNRWARIDQATLSYGYGVSVTSLQLARAYAVFANKGVRLPVSLLKQSERPQGERVLSERTTDQVVAMMESVVRKGGTGTAAGVPGYRVSGKTGTVKKLVSGGYSDNRYLSLFAGVAPASDPRLVMVVMVDEPRGKKFYGGDVAGPVFSTVMGEALRLLNIQPDAPEFAKPKLAQLGGTQ